MSAAELGKELGRTEKAARQYVQRRESGEYDYTDPELRRIADLTGVPLWFMLHGWDGGAVAPPEAESGPGPFPGPPGGIAPEVPEPETEVG